MMKSLRNLLTAAAILLAAPFFPAFAQSPDNDGHVLTDLWEQYEKAADADLPQLEAELLQKIKTEAAGKRLPVDFYDAATGYVKARVRRNWKERSDLEKALEAEVADFNEPIVTFLWMADYNYTLARTIYEYVEAHPDGFSGHNSAFYSRQLGQYLGGALPHFIANDREYVLWRMLKYYSKSGPLFDELKKTVQGRYPNEGCFGYATLTGDSKLRGAALDSLIACYPGKAVALYPIAEREENCFIRMTKENADSDAWKVYYEHIQDLEKQRNSYKGDEALIAKGCSTFQSIIDRLTRQDIGVSLHAGRAVVSFQNIRSATLTLRYADGKTTLRSWEVKNPKGSFYVLDTASVAIPSLKDGDYRFSVSGGGKDDYCNYEQYTLSLAMRQDARGWSAYVTDYQTGQPLTGPLTFHITKYGKDVATVSYDAKADFTLLPKAVQKELKEKQSLKISVETGSRSSRPRSHNTRYYTSDASEDAQTLTSCRIFRDRGAYHPGDTLRFKAILYSGNADKGYKVLASKKVEVNLFDSEYNSLEERVLKTGPFGSVSGEFVLPTDARGGQFCLAVYEAGKEDAIDECDFPVDEFVEPTYTLEFDKLEKLFLTGDSIPVSGRLSSYSGHPMSGASILLTVSRWGDLVAEDPVTPDPKTGAFTYAFTARGEGYYRITARVTDATGETLSYGTGVYVDSGVRLSATVLETSLGEFRLKDDSSRYYGIRPSRSLVLNEELSLSLQAVNSAGTAIPDYPVSYQLYRLESQDTVQVASGSVKTGENLKLPIGKKTALYLVKCSAESVTSQGWREVAERELIVLHLGEGTLPERVRYVFAEPALEPGGIRIRLGAADGPQWTVLALYDKAQNLLYSDMIRTRDGEVYDALVPLKAIWPEAVRVELFAFKDASQRSYGATLCRPAASTQLPLELIRKIGRGLPGTEYSFTLQTDPAAEVLVAVWDKSLEAIGANPWYGVTLGRSLPGAVTTLSEAGAVTGDSPSRDEDVIIAYGATRGNAVYEYREKAMVMEAAVQTEVYADEESADEAVVASPSGKGGEEDLPPLRSNFANVLTFQPHLRPDKEGKVRFSFQTADKLSTYIIGVFSHDKTMRNAVLKTDFLVTIPVRVALLEPRYLYSGDEYQLALTVSSIAEEPVSGTLRLDTSFLSGMTRSEAETTVFTQELTLDPGETVTVRVPVKALTVKPAFVGDRGSLTLQARFIAPKYTDGVEVTVPVYPAVQTLTESHSAVLRSGMDRSALIGDLLGRFVNVPGSAATMKEVSILDMVKAAIPTKVEPQGNDVLSLSEAWYVRILSGKLLDQALETDELLKKILDCQNPDGGFAWFEEMESSPVMTAVILERMAKIRAQGFEVPDLDDAVRYLDSQQFKEAGGWYFGLSLAQYLYIRSLYASVPFTYKPSGKAAEKRWSEFKKQTADYLVPSKKRGLSGQILAKARRLLTLRSLAGSKDGLALAKAWGIKGGASKLTGSMKADLRSLADYAVEHKDGGWYFPNAVMPWRGLLESEAYAHALLCDLFAQAGKNELADGIRLWLMLQKETQQWDSDPAFVDAISSILAGSKEVLDTRVIAFSATYTAPFADIAATGNGFTIERQLERLSGTEWVPIAEGESVAVGDRIRAKYQIYSDENRSFVRLIAGREASLRPVEQLSGAFYSFLRRGYREVKADRTIYFFDRYPEEKTSLTEEFFVQQAGSFVAPVVTIESCYAPHYRANGAFRRPLPVVAQ